VSDDKKTNPPAKSDPPAPKPESANPLQWVREGIAGIISLAVLFIAVILLYGTYNYARETPANADAAVAANRKESYERQKDVMLYALALLGTVTGYYLGRVPAELHAQQAQSAANNAQQQLQQTQTKLSDTAGSAAAAAAQVSVAEKEKHDAKSKLNRASKVLETAHRAINTTLAKPQSVRKTLGGESAAASDAAAPDVEPLRRAGQEVEIMLREIHGSEYDRSL
jgi:hypothetical protein